jgi:hypothetical protein
MINSDRYLSLAVAWLKDDEGAAVDHANDLAGDDRSLR